MKNREGASGIKPGTCLEIQGNLYQLRRETPVGLHLRSLSHETFGDELFFHWNFAARIRFAKQAEVEEAVYRHLSSISFETEEDSFRKTEDHSDFCHRFILTVEDARSCLEIAGIAVLTRLFLVSEKFNGRWPYCVDGGVQGMYGPHHLRRHVPDLTKYQDQTQPDHVLQIMELIQEENKLHIIADQAKHPVVRKAAVQLLATRHTP